MEPVHDYFTSAEQMNTHSPAWEQHDWSRSMPHWDSTSTSSPDGMPIWQYTAAVLNRPESMSYYPAEVPLSPISNHGPSPSIGGFQTSARFPNVPANYRLSTGTYNESASHVPVAQFVENAETEEDDEDSDNYTMWDAQPSPNLPTPPHRPGHKRSQSAADISSRSAKRAHTVVERNYRERLNDKIADLALYLFDTSSDSRTKPSKSLVMTRAKERLKQLEARNKSLESEVVKLRQHIAILDHIVASTRGAEGPGVPASS